MNPSSNEAPNATPSQTGAPGMGLPPAPALTPVPKPAGIDDTSTTSTSGSTVLNDNENDDKKWVDKAREVVRRTRGDPYRQNQELTVLKAEYMKQRYNKIIKVDK